MADGKHIIVRRLIQYEGEEAAVKQQLAKSLLIKVGQVVSPGRVAITLITESSGDVVECGGEDGA